MANNNEIVNKRRLKIIALVIVGVVSFIVSIAINISGMNSVINNETNLSGMVGFSVSNKSVKPDSKEQTNIDNVENEKIPETDILVNALPVVFLNTGDWDKMKSGFLNLKTDEDGNLISEDGYKIICNGKHVNCIIFNDQYKDEVVGHLKVGTDFKTIEKTLGTPTFKEKEYLGYKTREVYVFFYEDEVAIYANRKLSNEKLERLLSDYAEKIYTQGRTRFLVEIRNNFEDFTIEMNEEENVVTLTSIARQIIVKLDSLGSIEVELYNGYNIFDSENTPNYIDQGLYKTYEEDLVEIVEKERISVR